MSNLLEKNNVLAGGDALTDVGRVVLGRLLVEADRPAAGRLVVVRLVARPVSVEVLEPVQAGLEKQLVRFRWPGKSECAGGENADCVGRFFRPEY